MALNAPLGGRSRKFIANKVGRIAIVEREKVSFTGTVNGDNSITNITAITLTDTAKFQEVFYLDDSATFVQPNAKDTRSHVMNQTLDFILDDVENVDYHTLVNGRFCVLVQFPNGKWYLAGSHSLGLSGASDSNFSASAESGAAIKLTGICLGLAPNIEMTDVAVEALINSTVTPTV